ncbi:MAG: hypothetical protein KGH98_04645 [Candidatus Micrarchaeota archaeon]|nr:hypothetical protein [Candidatus Micrarchaeota archaeon]
MMEQKQVGGRDLCEDCRDVARQYSCIACGKRISNSDVKFVMPASMYGSTSSELPIYRRVSCSRCFEGLRTRRRAMVPRASRLRAIRKSLSGRVLMSRPIINMR